MSLKDKVKELKQKNKQVVKRNNRNSIIFGEETILELMKISEEQNINFFEAGVFFCEDRGIDEDYFFAKCDEKIQTKLKESALSANLIQQSIIKEPNIKNLFK